MFLCTECKYFAFEINIMDNNINIFNVNIKIIKFYIDIYQNEVYYNKHKEEKTCIK